MEKITNELAEVFKAFTASEGTKSVIDATTKAGDEDTGTFEVVITTENLDRYQEVISMAGWELEHYRANPVVLWGHDHNILIGVATSVEIVEGKLVAKGKFAPTDEGQEKRRLYDAGFLKATSVGFIEKEREGNLITKAELLEFSFVSVPANPYALSLAMQKELNINDLVTKGIFTLKDIKDTSETEEVVETVPEKIDEEVVEPVVEEAVVEVPAVEAVEPELTDEQKTLAAHITKQVIAAIKDSGALEVAGDSELERTDTDDDQDNPDVKAFEKKLLLQKGVTALSEVLAELRQADRAS